MPRKKNAPKEKEPTKKELREAKQALKKKKKDENVQAEHDSYVGELRALDSQLSALEKSSALRLEKNDSMAQLYENNYMSLDAGQLEALTLGIQEPATLASRYCFLEERFLDVKRRLVDTKFRGRTSHQTLVDALSGRFEDYTQVLQKLQKSVTSITTIKRKNAAQKLASEVETLINSLTNFSEQGVPTADVRRSIGRSLEMRDRLKSELKSLRVTIDMGGNKDLVVDRDQLEACSNRIDGALMGLIQKHHQSAKSLLDTRLTENQHLIARALFGDPSPAMDVVQEALRDTLALRDSVDELSSLENIAGKIGLSVAHFAAESAGWSKLLNEECFKLDAARRQLARRLQNTDAHEHPVPLSALTQNATPSENTQFSNSQESTVAPFLRRNG